MKNTNMKSGSINTEMMISFLLMSGNNILKVLALLLKDCTSGNYYIGEQKALAAKLCTYPAQINKAYSILKKLNVIKSKGKVIMINPAIYHLCSEEQIDDLQNIFDSI